MHQRTLKRLRRVWFKWERIKNPINFVERLIKITRRERLLRRGGDRMQAFYSKLIDFCERQPNAAPCSVRRACDRCRSGGPPQRRLAVRRSDELRSSTLQIARRDATAHSSPLR